MTETAQDLQAPSTLQVAHRTRTADGEPRGGDFTVLVGLPGGAVGLGIGDVAGHGRAVAGVAHHLQQAMHAAAQAGSPPAAVLARLNHELLTLDEDVIATAAYAVVHPPSGTLVHSSAGHLPFLCAAAEGATSLKTPAGLLLGACPDAAYEEGIVALPPGSTLLAYTDGLVERRGEDLDAGLRRLERTAGAAAGRTLLQQVDEVFARLGADSTDDVTLLGLRCC